MPETVIDPARHDKPRTLVVATRNQGKLVELRSLLLGLPLQLVDLNHVGIAEEVPETGATFEANAVQKATYVCERAGLPVLADDSGLCVDALDGAPGVYSARYGGPGLDDHGRVRRLLDALSGVAEAERGATFVCVLALARPGRPVVTAEGRVAGRIGWQPLGEGGFGYDPVFVLPERGLTTAQLTAAEKDAISHRARAARTMRATIQQLLGAADW